MSLPTQHSLTISFWTRHKYHTRNRTLTSPYSPGFVPHDSHIPKLNVSIKFSIQTSTSSFSTNFKILSLSSSVIGFSITTVSTGSRCCGFWGRWTTSPSIARGFANARILRCRLNSFSWSSSSLSSSWTLLGVFGGCNKVQKFECQLHCMCSVDFILQMISNECYSTSYYPTS